MFKPFAKLSHPIHLILAALTYILGAGIARYLGQPINVAAFLLGLLTSLSLLVAAFFFAEYFRLPLALLEPEETPRQRREFRGRLLLVSYAALSLPALIGLALLLTHVLNVLAGSLLILAFLLLLAYAIPPLRLSESGFGEFLIASYIAILLPALAFLLQAETLHRLVSLVTFPLLLLAIAWLLVLDFPTFAADQRVGRYTLLTRLTWQRAIPLHHLLVLAAFLLFAAAPFFGVPWALVWPVFLALPFVIFQVVWLQRIALGGRTLWNFITALAATTFGLTIYLLASTFWIR